MDNFCRGRDRDCPGPKKASLARSPHQQIGPVILGRFAEALAGEPAGNGIGLLPADDGGVQLDDDFGQGLGEVMEVEVLLGAFNVADEGGGQLGHVFEERLEAERGDADGHARGAGDGVLPEFAVDIQIKLAVCGGGVDDGIGLEFVVLGVAPEHR